MAKITETKTDKIEREYIIPLRHRWKIVPRYKRTNKAVKTVKEFLARHMKVRDRDLNKIKIDKYLNEVLWQRGIKKPLSKVKVRAVKEGNIVRAELSVMPERIKFKKAREDKKESAGREVAKKKKAEKTQVEEEVKVQAETDKNKDGVEDKKEEQEKKEATIEAEQKIEKAAAQEAKHTAKVKPMREEKAREKKVYNKSSRGH
jgi:large subunit ribosomal protein L31e